MAEISRILTAGGLVAGSTGLVVYAMGAAFVEPRDFELTIGMIMMVLGVIAAVIGIGMSKRIQEEE